MGVAAAVACAEELERELTVEIARAREERLLLKSADGPKLEARLAERRGFVERAEALQARLRTLVRAAAEEAGVPVISEDVAARLAEREPDAALLAARIAAIRALARELSETNRLNHKLAERALAVTRAYVRALSPRPAAYDRRGAESTHASALSSISRRA